MCSELPNLEMYKKPLSYAFKPKSLARSVFDIQVSYPFSDMEAPDWAGGRTAHFNPEVHPNLLGWRSHCDTSTSQVLESNSSNLKQFLIFILVDFFFMKGDFRHLILENLQNQRTCSVILSQCLCQPNRFGCTSGLKCAVLPPARSGASTSEKG